MPTPSAILRPVLEELDDDWVAPLSKGELEFDEDVGEEEGPALVDAVVVGLVLLVDGEEGAKMVTYSTPVGTEAEKSADVVGV